MKLNNKKRIIIIGVIIIILISIILIKINKKIIFTKNNKTEINEGIDYYSFIKEVKDGSKKDISIDSSKMKINKLGKYPITYSYKGKDYKLEIEVVDTKKPTFDIMDIEIDAGNKLTADKLVTNIKDDTKTKVSFKEKYDFSKEGKIKVKVIVSDTSNNKTEKQATVTVLPKDTTKPVINGLDDLTVTLNGRIDYLANVTVEDNQDPKVEIKVDDKEVSLDKLGDYYITYIATDRSGNKTTAKRKISVVEKKDIGVLEQTNEKVIYLTFDDGPSSNTAKVLDILDRYNAKATFFVTGTNQKYNYLIKEAYNRGNTIGLHTYSHNYSEVYASQDAYFNDLNKIGQMVKNEIGFVPKYIRFPGGSSNTISKKFCAGIMSTITQATLEQGYQYYDWNYGTGDASGNNIPTSKIIATATLGTANNQVILAHDTDAKNTTVEALPTIIEHYQALGYSFKGIDDNSFVPHHHVNN